MTRSRTLMLAAICGVSLLAAGCNTPGERALGGAAVGGLLGAGIGGVAGGGKGAAIGAALGAGSGAIIGAGTAPRATTYYETSPTYYPSYDRYVQPDVVYEERLPARGPYGAYPYRSRSDYYETYGY